jgi:hypothetical protein
MGRLAHPFILAFLVAPRLRLPHPFAFFAKGWGPPIYPAAFSSSRFTFRTRIGTSCVSFTKTRPLSPKA